MRILIDECVDPRVRTLFPGHEARTVHDMGWDRLADGPLLELAEQSFDVMITIDRSLEYQQNLGKFRLGVVVVEVPKNQMRWYRAAQAKMLAAVERMEPGRAIHVHASAEDE